MKKSTAKLISVILALSMLFTLSLSAHATQVTVEPNIVYSGASFFGDILEYDAYNIDIDGNFIDFADPEAENLAEIFIFNEETSEYDFVDVQPFEIMFESYSFEDNNVNDVSEIYVLFTDIEIDTEAKYLIVLPEGMFVTESGAVNSEISLEFDGAEFTPYELTPIDLIVMWFESLASYMVSPIYFILQTIMTVQALITGDMSYFQGCFW